MREYNSYVTLAAVVNGLAFQELFAAMKILYFIPHKQTLLFKSSLIAVILIFLVLLTSTIILDYISSPYNAPFGYLGILYGTAYVLNFISSILITFLFMIRIKIFYGRRCLFFKAMTFLGLAVVLVKSAADYFGIKISYAYATGATATPLLDADYYVVPFIMAFGSALEAVFSAAGSMSFLYYLTDFGSGNTWKELRAKVFMKEGVRLLLIVCVHLAIVVSAIFSAISETWISHLGYFLPSLAYAVEIRTFLTLSYRSAPNIIKEFEKKLSFVGERLSSRKECINTIGKDTVTIPVRVASASLPGELKWKLGGPLSPIPEDRPLTFSSPKSSDSIEIALG
jgi:hypothetical protein